MTMPERPFRFGVQVGATGSSRQWSEQARKIESLGYSTLTMPDHFDDQLAPVPALQCAADATSNLRLGALVHDNDYKHPVVLAKELATLDVLSGGRIEIGLGAGWKASDYEQSGIPYDAPRVRVDRLVEAVHVIRSALGPEPFSFAGEHYTITDYDGLPKPVQPRPPVLIGGGGPRMLRLAASEADIVGINPALTSGGIDQSTFASMTADAVDEKVAIVRRAATEAGRLDEIELNVRAYMAIVTDDTASALDAITQFTGASAEMIEMSPFALVGSPERIVDQLRERRERWGFSYVIVGQNEYEALAPVVASLAGT